MAGITQGGKAGDCSQCAKGNEPNMPQTDCVACPLGRFNGVKGGTCGACGSGGYAPVGATTCASCAKGKADADQARPATTTILGLFPSSFPDSNEPFCMLNHQRELTLPRLTAAPTANSSA